MNRDCEYCDSTVTESNYLSHLKEEHFDELSNIDRRRVVDNLGPPNRSHRNKLLVAGAVIIIGLSALIYFGAFVVFGPLGSSSDGGGESYEPEHEHGTLTVVIDGDELDFTESQYVMQDECFHFHDGEGEVWHTHCDGVTLEEALETLGIQVTETAITIHGTEYNDTAPDTSVSVTVNGETVDYETYELQGVGLLNEARDGAGDDIRIQISTTDD